MRITSFIAFFLFLAVYIFADQYATTDDGRRVLLKNNKRWKYVKTKSKIINSAQIGKSGAYIKVISWKDNIYFEENEYIKLGKGMRLFSLLIVIDNKKGTKKITINPVMGYLELKDDNGYMYKITMASSDKVKPSLAITDVAPKDITRGWATFEVKKGVKIKNLKIRYTAIIDDEMVSDWIYLKSCKKQK